MVKHFVQVYWGISGRGALRIGGEEKILGPNDIAVYMPGMEHRVYSIGEAWEYRWWTMDGALAVEIAVGFGLAADVFPAGPAPVELFEELREAILDLSANGERRASAIAYRLLSRIASGSRAGISDPLIDRIVRIVNRESADPRLGVETIAARLRTHRSTLSRRFRSAMGVSLIEYLTRLRVQNSLALLKESTMTVAEIARQCGYDDPNYFSRLIRRRTGHSPRMFRKR